MLIRRKYQLPTMWKFNKKFDIKKLQEEAFAGAAKPKYEQVASTKSKEDII